MSDGQMSDGQMSGVRWLPGAAKISLVHQLAGQQPDNLCGPYWLAILLQAWNAAHLDAAHLGQLAQSVLPIGDPEQWVPPGAKSRQDYSVPLPETAHLAEAGTAVSGLMAATIAASQNQFTLVPLAAQWSAEAVDRLLQLCLEHPTWEAVPVCNIRTGHLWGTSLTQQQAIDYLEGTDITPPAADWDVGHFVTIAGMLPGAARSLIVVRDTYPQFGCQGYHLQPAATIAAAMNRGDGNAGGVLLFVAASLQSEIEQQCQDLGWTIAAWDNGTPLRDERQG
jgi:hypothetical protein